ncbi:hypothetical protein ES704_01800 [subsurface metagenome]|jgi:hypothetical protein
MSTLFEYYITDDDDEYQVCGEDWEAQTFTPSVAHKITSVKLKLYREGSPGTLTVAIKAVDASHHPIGADLCSGTTDGNTLTTNTAGEWREITLGAGANLEADTEYAIILKALDGSISNKGWWRVDKTDGAYPGGWNEYTGDSGSTWDSAPGDDHLFEEWGEPAVTEKSASDTGSGVDASVALLAALVKSDAGSGVDAFTGNRGFILPDVGEGVESYGDRDFGAAEEGLGEDLASLLAERIRADSGMGMDALISFLTSVSKFGTDSGAGVDVAILKAFRERLDTGIGVEAIVGRDIVKAEVGAGLDALAALLIFLVKSDTGEGLDQGEKLSIDQVLQAIDSGVGVDEAIVSCIGLLLRGIAFTKPYLNGKTYCRPYLDGKTYTGDRK